MSSGNTNLLHTGHFIPGKQENVNVNVHSGIFCFLSYVEGTSTAEINCSKLVKKPINCSIGIVV